MRLLRYCFHNYVLRLIVISTVIAFGRTSLVYAEIVLTSGDHQTQLVELFTSQGCSSCPPAERWINDFGDSELLWQSVVPVSFHVDYWDYLGWKDPFSSKKFSQRQRDYKHNGNVQAVYTPGFVVNGEEWRDYYRSRQLPKRQPSLATLKASVGKERVNIVFTPKHKGWSLPIDINIALLGHDIHTVVSAGENARRTLVQGFVVLEYEKVELNANTLNYVMPDYQRDEIKRYAIAIWASHPISTRVVQAVGGWIP